MVFLNVFFKFLIWGLLLAKCFVDAKEEAGKDITASATTWFETQNPRLRRAYPQHRYAHLPPIPPGRINVLSHSYRKPPIGVQFQLPPVVNLALERRRHLLGLGLHPHTESGSILSPEFGYPNYITQREGFLPIHTNDWNFAAHHPPSVNPDINQRTDFETPPIFPGGIVNRVPYNVDLNRTPYFLSNGGPQIPFNNFNRNQFPVQETNVPSRTFFLIPGNIPENMGHEPHNPILNPSDRIPTNSRETEDLGHNDFEGHLEALSKTEHYTPILVTEPFEKQNHKRKIQYKHSTQTANDLSLLKRHDDGQQYTLQTPKNIFEVLKDSSLVHNEETISLNTLNSKDRPTEVEDQILPEINLIKNSLPSVASPGALPNITTRNHQGFKTKDAEIFTEFESLNDRLSRRLRRGRKRQRPFKRGPVIKMSELVKEKNDFQFQKIQKTKNSAERTKITTSKITKAKDYLNSSNFRKDGLFQKSKSDDKESKEYLNTQNFRKEGLFQRSKSDDKERKEFLNALELRKEGLFQKPTKSDDKISLTSSKLSDSIPKVKVPFARSIVSGMPFLVEGHEHMGRFTAVQQKN